MILQAPEHQRNKKPGDMLCVAVNGETAPLEKDAAANKFFERILAELVRYFFVELMIVMLTLQP